jgi:hypothetical protein
MKEGRAVKIQRKIHKRLYLEGKSTYKYERLYLPIPKRFNELLKPYLNQTLNLEVKNEGDRLTVTMSKMLTENSKTPRKNVSVPRKHPAKIMVENRF